MKLVIVGTGYVGLVSGACFAEFGYETICIDKDTKRIQKLKLGKCPFYEPGMDNLLSKHLNETKLLSFSLSLSESIKDADLVFITVGTPSRRLNDDADLSYVWSVADEIAKNIFGPGDSVLAWGAGQAGKAVACDGGYKVSGTWRFASGAGHATWLGGHSMVFEEDGSPRINKEGKHVDRTALFVKTAAMMKDDWHVVGLKGTRSESYSVEDMFIPESHTLDREAPEECRVKSPLYVFPTTLVYASCFSGVALGIARGSLDDLIRLAQTKVQRAARSSLRESPVFQSQLAELEAKWGAAKAYQQATLIEITDRVVDTRLLSMSDRAKIRLATTYAINEATDVVQKVYRLAGSTAIFENQPFERRFRDMHAVSQQMQARYTHFETVGRHLMDLDNTAAHM